VEMAIGKRCRMRSLKRVRQEIRDPDCKLCAQEERKVEEAREGDYRTVSPPITCNVSVKSLTRSMTTRKSLEGILKRLCITSPTYRPAH